MLTYVVLIYADLFVKRKVRRKKFCTFRELGNGSLHYLYYKNAFLLQYNSRNPLLESLPVI